MDSHKKLISALIGFVIWTFHIILVESQVSGLGPYCPTDRITNAANINHQLPPTIYHRTDRIVLSFGITCINEADHKLTYTWKLFRSDLNEELPEPSSGKDWKIDHLVNVDLKYIIFRPHQLIQGNYLVQVLYTVKDTDKNTYSLSGYFVVLPNKPKVIIRDGAERTANVNRPIILDGSLSVDANHPERTNQLTFLWTCPEIPRLSDNNRAILVLSPHTLLVHRNYTFSLAVHSPSSKLTEVVTQIIHTSFIEVKIKCLANCDKSLHPHDTIEVQCTSPEVDSQPNFTFSWTPQENVPIRKIDNTRALITLPDLQGIREPNGYAVCSTEFNNVLQTAKLVFTTSLPPEDAICLLGSPTVTYLKETVLIVCHNVSSEDSFHHYNFYAKIDGHGAEALDNKLLLFYGNSPFVDVYLPLGSEKDGELKITVEIGNGAGGINKAFNIKVEVIIPPANEYVHLLDKLVFDPNSELRSLMNNGAEQEALQLIMAIVDGLASHNKEMEPALELLKSENLLNPLIEILTFELLKVSLNSQKAIQQVIGALNLLAKLKTDNEDPFTSENVYEDVNYLLVSASSILRVAKQNKEFVLNGNEEESTSKDLDNFGTAVADTASRILKLANDRGNYILHEDGPVQFFNERSAINYDVEDDINRDYFGEFHENVDDEEDKELEDIAIGDVDNTATTEIVLLATASREASMAIEHVMDIVAEKRLPSQEAFQFQDSHMAIHVEVEKASELSGKVFTLQTQGSNKTTVLQISADIQPIHETESNLKTQNVEIQLQQIDENPFFDDLSALPSTPVVSVVVKDADTRLPLQFNRFQKHTDTPFQIHLSKNPLNTNITNRHKTWHNVTVVSLQTLETLDLVIIPFILEYNRQFEITIADYQPNISYVVAFVKDENPTKLHFCEGEIVKEIPTTQNKLYTAVFETEYWDYGIGDPPGEKLLEYHVAIWAKDNSDSQDLIGTNTTFSVYFTRTGCMFRDENRKFWSENGCIAKNNPEDDKIFCTCTHLSSFAGSVFILPHDLQTFNLVDIDLESLKGNYIVLITVCTCFLLYIICMIWCYLLDRRESSKFLPITIMADLSNDLEHSLYLVTILTGTRFDAGTTANVSLQIYGSHGRSKIYTLKETSSGRVFVRGDIATYLISTPKDLGNLEKIRLWHDNYGGSPSWYCNKIIIRNIKTNVESQFFVEHWLSVCHKNPMLLIQRDKATIQDERNFYRRFKQKLADEFNNAHLWFSVIICPPTSNFYRRQRLSCAYAALCMYMLLSIMFRGLPTDDYRSKYDVGITEIDVNNLIVWIENLCIDCAVGFLIGYLFRSVRERHIPTLIIWRNKTKPGKSSKSDNLFVPKVAPVEPIRSKKPKIGEDELGGLGNSLSDSGSSTFSIPSTDIQEVEGWLINQTDGKEIRHSYDLREPDTFIHLVDERNDKDNLDSLQRLGRHALVHSVRDIDPDSFVFEGENDIPGIEKLIDEQLRLQSKEKNGKNKQVAKPWQNLKMSDLKIIEEELHMQSGPILTAEETKESIKGLVIELCDLTPIEKTCGCCGYLPWWCIYLAWIVFFAVIGVCSYFTILYGFRLGYLRSLDWFLSVVVSFLKSVFIFQPILIALRATVKSLCSKKLKKVNQDRFQLIVREGDEEIHGKKPRKITIFQPERIHLPLNGHELFILKMEARRRIDLRRKFIYIILYTLLLCPLIYIAHSGHTKYNYRITENLRNMFRLDEINRGLVKYPYEAFLNIEDEYSLYGYLKLTFLPSLHPRRKYNGDIITTPRFDAAYLIDDTTILIGVARIRQLRMMNQSCEISSKFPQLSSSNCIRDYDISKQDTTTYNTLWTPVEEGKSRVTYSKTNDIWKFRSSNETKALPISGHMAYYDGGGYVAELGRTLRESKSVLKYLRRVHWFDKHTRCIFIEFSTYTPSVNIFSSVILMIERGSSQGIYVSSTIYPMIVAHGEIELAENLDDPTQVATWEEVNVVLTVMMLAVLVLMLCWVLWYDYEGKIIQRFWFWLDSIIILSIFISLVIAYTKKQVMTEIEDKIENLLINEFISLQHGALWDQIQSAAFSLTQIFCFVRMWNILMHSSDKFLMLTLTLKLTSNVLFAFTILFSILLLAFALAGYLIFGSYLYEFRTIHQTFITLAHQIFKSNFFYDLEKTNRILGPLYFLFFGFFVVIISLNLFVALLNEGFYKAKQITIERRHWITYWTYAADFAKSMFRKRRKPKPRMCTEGNCMDILPSRLLEMKKVTIQFLQNRLHADEEALMKNMKTYADNLLQGTGMCMVSKDAKLNLEKEHKEKRMEEMRVCTLEFLKKRKQVNMSSEELREYEKYDDHIASIRLRKLEKKIEIVTEHVDRLVRMKL